jgi:hypothetical protein
VNSCIDGDGSNPFFKNFISVFNTSAVDDCCMCFGLWILLCFASRLYISQAIINRFWTDPSLFLIFLLTF